GKLETFAAEFAAPQVMMVLHAGRLLDSGTGRLGARYPPLPNRRVVLPAGLPPIGTAPGFALAARRDVFDGMDTPARPAEASGNPDPRAHDPCARCVACALGEMVLRPEELVHYRRHSSNASTLPTAPEGRTDYAAEATLDRTLAAYLASMQANVSAEKRVL